ncbi:hypothetical protein IWW56_005286, partial [Coemansia sp. RSA 2131]
TLRATSDNQHHHIRQRYRKEKMASTKKLVTNPVANDFYLPPTADDAESDVNLVAG